MNWIRLTGMSALLVVSCMANYATMGQSEDAVISKTAAVIRARFANIQGYTVTEHYAVYRNGSTTPSAEKTVLAIYEKSKGIRYTTISQSGSSTFQNRVIEPSLGSEKQIYDPTMRGQLMLTTENYEIGVEPARSFIGTQDCVVLDVKARKPSVYLINGKAWVDAKTYLLARVQGTQSKSSSLWAGTPLVTRDFTNVNGFAMVTHEKIEAHNFLLGQTVEEIEYKDYKLVGDAKSAVQ
jgi:outer membrane lipoprotein-sorting protein